VDANSHRNSFVYDADSRQTQLIDPLGRRTTYGFDAASRQTLRIDARGFRTSYVYDNDNRLTGKHYPDGSRVTFAYDNASRRRLLNDATGRTTSIFDADGRLSAVINPAGLRLTYAYDAASQRKYLVEPEGARFTYAFDAAGRTKFVTNSQAQRATWSFDAVSRVTGVHYANTTRTSYLYDNASRLLRVANLSSTSTTLSSFSYALDPVGNRLRVVESTGNRVTWSYDKTYQLKNEQRSGSNGYNITYTYDPVGNRLSEINGGVRTTSSYNAANELSRTQVVAGITTYTSDAAGNLLASRNPSNQRTTNTWDFENRLTQVALPSAIVDTFTYNGDGQRVQKIDSTGTTKHVWDGQNILLETDGSNIIQVVYTLQPVLYGNLISQRRSGTTSFYLFDGLGSTTQLVNSTGTVTDSYLYDSFGDALLTSGSTVNPFRYVGRVGYYMDVDTAPYYLRARYYTPGIGLFLSRDPIGIFSAEANLYCYVGNRPTFQFDPSGLLALKVCVCPPSGNGYIYIDCSCRGKLSIWVVPENGPVAFVPRCGVSIPADGFQMKGYPLQKMTGGTCISITCSGGGATLKCCINRVVQKYAQKRGKRCSCPFTVPPGTFGGGPKEPPPGTPPTPVVGP
jgi:RHS repeat-associated protein